MFLGIVMFAYNILATDRRGRAGRQAYAAQA